MSVPRPVHALQPPPIGLWSDKPAMGEPIGSNKGSLAMRQRVFVDIATGSLGYREFRVALSIATEQPLTSYGRRFGLRWFVHKDRETGRWLISRRFFYLQSKRGLRPAGHDSERDTSAQQF